MRTVEDAWDATLILNWGNPMPKVIARAIRAELGLASDEFPKPAMIPWKQVVAGEWYWTFEAPGSGIAGKPHVNVTAILIEKGRVSVRMETRIWSGYFPNHLMPVCND